MTLRAFPPLDSNEKATQARRLLDIDRHHAAELGRLAVLAASSGSYELPDGAVVDWAADVRAATESKISIPPGSRLPAAGSQKFAETLVTVSNEPTLSAARRMAEAGDAPLVLNMANGVTPGGGFQSGSRAQEETLCRSSSLYNTLVGDEMYSAHRERADYESSDWVILSPRVPVFRDDAGNVLPQPWHCSFLTCAAPYAPKVGSQRSAELLGQRIERILNVAHAYGYESLVLGAWGCGAYGNDPRLAAASFGDTLSREFDGAFRQVVFAVTDWSPRRQFLGPFRDEFSPRKWNSVRAHPARSFGDESLARGVVCPQPGAPLSEMLEFALTYDGYGRIASSPEHLGNLLEPFFAEWHRDGLPPDWAGIDLLRAALFWLQRGAHHRGDEESMLGEFDALVDAIRDR